MEIRESYFFNELICWAGWGPAPPRLEELRDLFADPVFWIGLENLPPLGGLGDWPMRVSELPTFELPDTVLFPDQTVTLTVSRTDPLFRLVEQGRVTVRLGDEPATLIKFRSRFSQPREDDGVPGPVCTLGTVRVTARHRSEAILSVLTYARVSDQGSRPGRNPVHPIFDACADFPELRENFVKLIYQFPGLDAVSGSHLLDTLEAIEQVGREYDKHVGHEYDMRFWREYEFPDLEEDGGNEPPERPVWFLDVAADFIAISLIQWIPDLAVPVRLQQEWLDMLDPCTRVRALNAFVVEVLDDMMTPDRIYARALEARIKHHERVLVQRGDDPLKEELRSEGDRFLQQKLKDARKQLKDPVARLRGKFDTCGMPREVRARLQPEIDRLSAKTDAKTMECFRCLADLPWTGGKADTLDLERARGVLDERHFGLREAKERILEYLAVRRRKRDARGSVLCFAGPPSPVS